MSEFGLNFLPSEGAPDQAAATALTPAQSAIKILSLRLPQILGNSAPVARSLLTSNPGQAPTPGLATVSPGGVNVANDFDKPMSPYDMVLDALRRSYGGGDVSGVMRSMGFPNQDGVPRANPAQNREGYTVRTSFGNVDQNGPQQPNPYQSPTPAPTPTPQPNPTPEPFSAGANIADILGGRQY